MTPQRGKWWTLTGISLGVFMATLNVSIVNISLPTLVERLETDFATIQWVILGFVLVATSLMLSAARLGDMAGKKKLYITGLYLFIVGSLLCGLAPGVGWLIAFRALQGVGAVLLQALGMAIITEIFPPSQRGRALGITGGIVSLGLTLGPALGGLLIDLAGWRSIFLVNVPVGLVALYVVHRFVPRMAPARADQRFDVAGAVVFFLTMACYALGMTFGQRLGFAEPSIRLLLAAAVVGLAVFLVVEARVGQPMLDLGLFRNPLFSLNLAMNLLVFITLAGTFVMPFFLQLVSGYSVRVMGLLMMVLPVCMGLVSPLAGALSDRFGSRGMTLAGLLVTAGGCLALSTLDTEVGWLGFVLRLAPLGIGMGLFGAPNNSAVMGAAPRESLGVASGLLAFSRNLGMMSGLPLMGMLFTSGVLAAAGMPAGGDYLAAPAAALVAGVTRAYRVAFFIALAAVVLAIIALIVDRRRQGSKV